MKQLDDDSLCADMNNQIREMAGSWHVQMTNGANGCSLPFSRLAEQYAWVALAGNMIWAGASLLAFISIPEIAVPIAGLGAVMNFGGAMTGAIPGILSARGIGEHPADSSVATLKSCILSYLDKAKSRLLEQSAMVALTHSALPIIKKKADQARRSGQANHAMDLDTAQEARRRLLWACMFPSVFKYNDFDGIRNVAQKSMTEMFELVMKLFDEYQTFVDGQVDGAVQNNMALGKPGLIAADRSSRKSQMHDQMMTSSAFLTRLRATREFRQFVQKPEMNGWYKCAKHG